MATFPLADIMTGSRTLNVKAVGNAADNAAASGNPVRVAAKYNSATQTYSDGDTADLQADVSGNLKTVLRGRRETHGISDLGQALSVNAGAFTSITATPVAGTLWTVNQLSLNIPAPVGAGSGTHKISLRLYDTAEVNSLLEATQAYNGEIYIKFNYVYQGTTIYPANAAEQQRAILNMRLSNTVPLVLVYFNDTNVAQTGNLTYKIIREVEFIVD